MLTEGKCDGEFTRLFKHLHFRSGSFDALLGQREETTQRLCGLLLPEKIALKSPATLREEDSEKSEK